MSLEREVIEAIVAHVKARRSFDAGGIAAAVKRELSEVSALVRARAPALLEGSGYRLRAGGGGLPLYNPYSGEPVRPQQADPRTPTEMPAEWLLRSVEGGRGLLEREGVRLEFEMTAWAGAGHQDPGRKVCVGWERSLVGDFNVVRTVTPDLSDLPPPPTVPLAEVLAEWKAATGGLRGVTVRRLGDALTARLGVRVDPKAALQHELDAVPWVLEELETGEPRSFLSFVWQDDATDACVEHLTRLLGLPDARGGAVTDDAEAFIASLNALSAGPERVFVVHGPGDLLLARLTPLSQQALTKPRADGLVLLRASLPRPGPPTSASPRNGGGGLLSRLKALFG
jgi:hypothetical protein